MKISELLHLRDRINRVFNTGTIAADVDKLKHDMGHIMNIVPDPDYRELLLKVLNDIDTITKTIGTAHQHYDDFLSTMREEISEEELKFFGDNYKLEIKHNAVDVIRNLRIMNTPEGVKKEVLDRIKLYTSWKYPALEIGCRDGEYTKHMVAADPLYVVDYYRDFIDSTTQQFPQAYQNRLRPYLVKEPTDMIDVLPNNQFGFIFCWNFINYASFDTVKEYLKVAKELLRPGGTFMFSYNDGDRPAGAAMAESYFMTYVPKHMLLPLCESLGFIIANQRTRDTSVSWVELQKPGTLETVKAHQVLGKINLREN